jgi:hypothetical protein
VRVVRGARSAVGVVLSSARGLPCTHACIALPPPPLHTHTHTHTQAQRGLAAAAVAICVRARSQARDGAGLEQRLRRPVCRGLRQLPLPAAGPGRNLHLQPEKPLARRADGQHRVGCVHVWVWVWVWVWVCAGGGGGGGGGAPRGGGGAAGGSCVHDRGACLQLAPPVQR